MKCPRNASCRQAGGGGARRANEPTLLGGCHVGQPHRQVFARRRCKNKIMNNQTRPGRAAQPTHGRIHGIPLHVAHWATGKEQVSGATTPPRHRTPHKPMALEHRHLAPRLHAPHMHGPIIAARQHIARIGRERRLEDGLARILPQACEWRGSGRREERRGTLRSVKMCLSSPSKESMTNTASHVVDSRMWCPSGLNLSDPHSNGVSYATLNVANAPRSKARESNSFTWLLEHVTPKMSPCAVVSRARPSPLSRAPADQRRRSGAHGAG